MGRWRRFASCNCFSRSPRSLDLLVTQGPSDSSTCVKPITPAHECSEKCSTSGANLSVVVRRRQGPYPALPDRLCLFVLVWAASAMQLAPRPSRAAGTTLRVAPAPSGGLRTPPARASTRQPAATAQDAKAKAYVQASDGAEAPASAAPTATSRVTYKPITPADYGFRARTARDLGQREVPGQIPASGWDLAQGNFKRELRGLRTSVRFQDFSETKELLPKNIVVDAMWGLHITFVDIFASFDKWLEDAGVLPRLNKADSIEDPAAFEQARAIRKKLRKLRLSNSRVAQRERDREEAGLGAKGVPLPVKVVYKVLCLFLDLLFYERPIQRFWFLETVARMPYFSYTSMLHLYESLGWWRAGSELRKVHFAEDWNELQHLAIMESLGGDQLWIDRFAAQHAAVLYFWILVVLYLVSPATSYKFSELLEGHAVDTYGEFLDANEALLRTLPPPECAVTYYRSGDLYLFDDFQTSRWAPDDKRRPTVDSLYDVFRNIRDDEGEHVKTMVACQDMSVVMQIDQKRKLVRPKELDEPSFPTQ